MGQELVEQRLARFEVKIERALRDSRGFGNAVDGSIAVAVFSNNLRRSAEDSRPGFFGPFVAGLLFRGRLLGPAESGAEAPMPIYSGCVQSWSIISV